MEVILLERIERLGQMGDIVKVKPGMPATICCLKLKLCVPAKKIWLCSNPARFSWKPPT